jgi:O-antigen/teichoic acid export membrane protein
VLGGVTESYTLPGPDHTPRIDDPGAPFEPPRRTGKRSFIGRNIAVLLGSQAVTWGLALILTIVIPRYLGPSGVGQLRLGLAVWTIATVVAELGTSVLLTLEFAHDPARGFAHVRPVLQLRFGGAIVASFGVVVFLWIAGYDLETCAIVMIVGIGLLVAMLGDIARNGLFGLQWMSATAKVDIISKALTVALVVAALLIGGRTGWVATVMIVPAIVGSALLFRALFSRRSEAGVVPSPSTTTVLRNSSPFLYGSVVTAGYSSLDVVIISLLANEQEVGWYAAAATLMGTLLFLPNTIVTSLFPALAQAHRESEAAAFELLARATRTTMLMAVPIGIGTIVIATPLVTRLYGADFAPAGQVLAAGGVVLLLMFPTIMVGGVARAVGKVRVFNIAMTVATVLTVPLDLIFVPWTRDRFGNGAIGGALSFICTEALVLAILTWKVAPILVQRPTLIRLAKCGIAGVALFVAGWPVRDEFILIPIIASAVAYTAVILLLRTLDDDEKEMARKLWLRIRSFGRTDTTPTSPLVNEANT